LVARAYAINHFTPPMGITLDYFEKIQRIPVNSSDSLRL